MLGSPRFGERWGRHWLDLARYAETRGHELDYLSPNAWQYRDYVVRAFNLDLPYDQFVREHFAGDLLARPRRHPKDGFDESVLGTGFWTLGEAVHSPVDLRSDHADRLDNMVDVAGKTFFGLTFSCARCHDHKFDPISAKDYYGFAGFFAGSATTHVPLDAAAPVRKKLNNEHISLSAKRQDLLRRIVLAVKRAPQVPSNVTSSPASASEFKIHVDYSRPDEFLGGDCNAYARVAIGEAERFDGSPEDPGRFATLAAAAQTPAGREFRSAADVEAPPGVVASAQRPGRTLRTASFLLGGRKLHYLVRGKGHAYAAVQSHYMIAGPLHAKLVLAFDTGGEYRWVTHDLSTYADHRAYLEFSAAPGAELSVARIVESAAPPAPPVTASSPRTEADWKEVEGFAKGAVLPTEGAARLANGLLAERSKRLVKDALAKFETEAKSLASQEAAITKRLAELPAAPIAPALGDGSGVDLKIAIRGNPKALGIAAPRKLPDSITTSAPALHGSGRLELAEQVVDPRVNPFLPRVFVNRVWHHAFGRGIVPSVDNFGVMGEAPSHPELLDHLASEFVRDGWSIKRLIRRIALSRTFQMASASAPGGDERDPQNRLLHRAPVRRLDAEALRDSLLFVSGRLDEKVGGRPVPVHLTEFQEGRGRPASGPIDGAGRRSIYLAVRRNFLSPFLLAFDMPTPFSSVGRRTASNVPSQALILMNDPMVHLQAERWANRLANGGESDADRLRTAYLQAFGRVPSASEIEACKAFLTASGGASAERWKDLCHSLFNVKEFSYLK
jgi:hypothetical protein